MKVKDLYNLCRADISSLSSVQDVVRCANKSIREINYAVQGIRTTDTLTGVVAQTTSATIVFADATPNTFTVSGETFSTKGVAVGDLLILKTVNPGTYIVNTVASETQLTISNSTYGAWTTTGSETGDYWIVRPPSVIAATSKTNQYSFDWTNSTVTLGARTKIVEQVFINDLELEIKDQPYAYDSDRTKDYVATFTGRRIMHLPSNRFTGSGDTLKFRVEKDLSVIDTTDWDTTIDIPSQYEQVLISGTKYCLLALPKYKDADLYTVEQQNYTSEMQALQNNEVKRLPGEDIDVTYRY
tara:strand:- start:2453 stop:3349 length:897 start_codon:yes stop_codon:yes gene_type:complete